MNRCLCRWLIRRLRLPSSSADSRVIQLQGLRDPCKRVATTKVPCCCRWMGPMWACCSSGRMEQLELLVQPIDLELTALDPQEPAVMSRPRPSPAPHTLEAHPGFFDKAAGAEEADERWSGWLCGGGNAELKQEPLTELLLTVGCQLCRQGWLPGWRSIPSGVVSAPGMSCNLSRLSVRCWWRPRC